MSQRTFVPLLGTFVGTCKSTAKLVPSQLKAVRREPATEFWKLNSIRISTNWRLGFAAAPDMTSSMSAT